MSTTKKAGAKRAAPRLAAVQERAPPLPAKIRVFAAPSFSRHWPPAETGQGNQRPGLTFPARIRCLLRAGKWS